MEQIGFVILSHNRPKQLLRLVRRLQRMYDNPPIAVHHDMGQSALRLDDFPVNVDFVSPHIKTRWGKFSVVTATLRALQLLYAKAEPNWFFLLSAADYPIMPAKTVLSELAAAAADALLDYRQVQDVGTNLCCALPGNPALKYFGSNLNLAKAWHRYVGWNVWFPIIRKGPRLGRYTFYSSMKNRMAPFGPEFKCFYGDHWFAGNSKVAQILLNPSATHLRLRRYLRLRDSPEECYYPTVLANSQGLRISTSTRRFTVWAADGNPHPKVLDSADLPAIVRSGDYFARKFVPNSPLLDKIDKILDDAS